MDTARAMSQENVEIVRRGHEAFQRGELTAMLELVDPVGSSTIPLADPDEYHGPEGSFRCSRTDRRLRRLRPGSRGIHRGG